MESENVERSLHWRYATKVFNSTRLISPEHWKVLEEAFLLCPSSYGLQPWRFAVVKNKTLRAELRKVSWNQAQVTDASHYVVLLCREKMDAEYIAKYIDRVSDVRGEERLGLARYEEMMKGALLSGDRSIENEAWAKNQVYIAMGFLLQAAAMLKIDTCPMEGLDPLAYDELLQLKGSGYRTVASIAFGYRDSTDRYQSVKKVRFPAPEIILEY